VLDSGQFALEPSEDPRGYRLVIRGELDILQRDATETALILAELSAGERMLILDLRLLEFCSSVAIPLFRASAERRAAQNGRRLLILPSAAVSRLFDLAEVTELFDIELPDSADGS
jgi:anti-anti-sigma factor